LPTDFRLHIDPAEVLGISRDATIQEIHEAYRSKAKRYHPDAGGEDWAFRILSQAYEIMSRARVALRASAGSPAAAPPRQPPTESAAAEARHADRPTARPFVTEPPRARAQAQSDSHESVRPGVHETATDPGRVVDVEKVSIRFEPDHIWLITDRSRDDRFLSSSLNVTWPDPAFAFPPTSIPEAETILRGLAGVFETLRAQTQPVSASSSVDDGRFSGWVSYPNDQLAQAAFTTFRELVHGIGLTVNQWSRELVIPRKWR
jgi:hypothetical protein